VIRRRIAVVLVGIAATTSVAFLPAAHATGPSTVPTVVVPARTWGCAWVDVLHVAYCLSG